MFAPNFGRSHVNAICIKQCLAYRSKIYDIVYGGLHVMQMLKQLAFYSVFMPLHLENHQN